MNIIELKKQIENKTLDDSFLIFKYEDVSFIANQYISEIGAFKKRQIIYVNSFDTISENLFGDDDMLYVMKVDKIVTKPMGQSLNNKIIICRSIDECLIEPLKEFIVDIPKLQQWQIRAYATKNLPGLSIEEVNWLSDITKDIYRLSNEVDKIRIFDKNEQSRIFNLLNDEDSYSDLNSNTIFNFTNAISKRDIKAVKNILDVIDTIDVEPVGVVTLLYKSFKNLIDIQLTANPSAESLGMSSKQFSAIRYNVGKFSNDELIKIFDKITLIDYKLKSGNLDNELIIDYLLINIL